MRIRELVAYHVHIPLRRRIRHASYTRTVSDNLVVSCTLEDGTQGFGEGVPRDYVTGETIDGALDLLKRSQLEQSLGQANPDSFAAAVAMAENLRLALLPSDPRQCRSNAARCAVELALLDAFGRHFGQSLSTVTQLLTPDLWAPRRHVQYSGAITSARGWKTRLYALFFRVFGFAECKVKVGMDDCCDVERLASVRRFAGRRMNLRIDANEAWTPHEVVERIRELEPFHISSIEQPVAHEHVRCLAEVRKQIQTPIMHDESLCSLVDAEAAVREGTCDLFNLRLSKCGGYIPTLRLAQFARQHGLGYQLGCQVGETAILSAAGRHFACSVREIRHLEGSYDRQLVKAPLSRQNITFGFGGWSPALERPGLGIDIDPDALQRVTVRKEVLLG